jgi:hypothetical protein
MDCQAMQRNIFVATLSGDGVYMHGNKACAVAFLVSGFFGGVADGQEAKDMHLEDVGFVMRPASTPEQLARLRLLPPLKFVTRTKNGQRYYLFADPDLCKCVFVGNQMAMNGYHDLVTPSPSLPGVSNPASDNILVQDMDPGVSGSITDGDILDYEN